MAGAEFARYLVALGQREHAAGAEQSAVPDNGGAVVQRGFREEYVADKLMRNMGVNGGTRLDNVAEEHLLLHDDERACLAVAHALNRLGYLDYRVSDGLKNIVLPALEDKAETREFAPAALLSALFPAGKGL